MNETVVSEYGPDGSMKSGGKQGESLLFHMRDKSHDFSIGLSEVLKCLNIALEKGCVPELPENWFREAEAGYKTVPEEKENRFNRELPKDAEAVLENRAEAVGFEEDTYSECGERLVFHMKDRNGKFIMGMSSILTCLGAAAENGCIPKLPAMWCRRVETAYWMKFADGAKDFG